MEELLNLRSPDMLAAISTIKEDPTLSIRQVADETGVDRSTLTRQLKNPTTAQLGQQYRQRLSYIQEKWLAQWIIDEDNRGFAPRPARVKQMGELLLTKSGDNKPLGKKWIDSYKSRNQEVACLIGRPVDKTRLNGANPKLLSAHFSHFWAKVSELSVQTKDIWNMDETGTQLGASKRQIVMGDARKKSTYIADPTQREWVTTIECISATGCKTRPLTIFKGKSVQLQWFNAKDTPDWRYTTSENGWTSTEIGIAWLEGIFIPETRPIDDSWRILVVDGHGSHISVEFLYLCKINRIQLIFLPPHTSHITQPLDLTCFSPIKTRYREKIAELAVFDDASKVKKERFITAYRHARDESLTERVIRSGFRKAGLIPYNPEVVLQSPFVKQAIVNEPTSIKQEIKPLKTSNSPKTPKKYQDFQKWTKETRAVTNSPQRSFLLKAGRQFDSLTTQMVSKDYKIRQLEAQLEALQLKKKRKKVIISPTEQFVTIEAIRATQKEEEEKEAAKKQKAQKQTKNQPKPSGIQATQEVGDNSFQNMCFTINFD
jgi:hypothetical protein